MIDATVFVCYTNMAAMFFIGMFGGKPVTKDVFYTIACTAISVAVISIDDPQKSFSLYFVAALLHSLIWYGFVRLAYRYRLFWQRPESSIPQAEVR